jgi:hypothetical protein
MALTYYLKAFRSNPNDPLINMCTGICYLQRAMQRRSENRHSQIVHVSTNDYFGLLRTVFRALHSFPDTLSWQEARALRITTWVVHSIRSALLARLFRSMKKHCNLIQYVFNSGFDH